MLGKLFNKLAGGDPKLEANLMIFFIFLLTGLFFVLGANMLFNAIKYGIWTSYLWSAVLFIFAVMQSFSLKSMILAKVQEKKAKEDLGQKGLSIGEEVTPEQINRLLDEANEETNY